jgi:hypothetical protein
MLFANIHRYDLKIYHTGWRNKCKIWVHFMGCYLRYDACPMEGVDVKALGRVWLTRKGVTALAVVSLGYRKTVTLMQNYVKVS